MTAKAKLVAAAIVVALVLLVALLWILRGGASSANGEQGARAVLNEALFSPIRGQFQLWNSRQPTGQHRCRDGRS
jgi:hypothetical protein